MTDISIRITGRTGRITLQRPKALNALTYQMILDIEKAIDAWATDDQVAMVVIDAEGDKAFAAGGDIRDLYDAGMAGDFDFGRTFWADEYRLNHKIFNFPKPYAAFMQGFTMGGGVGVSCHGSHRIVGDTSRIAMPECGIGLVPDVGGSLILARAPGRLGEYLGTTGARMDAGDAIYAGFADYYIPEEAWPGIIGMLERTGDWTLIDAAAQSVPASKLATQQDLIDQHFGGETIGDILRSFDRDPSDWTAEVENKLSQGSPLSIACTIELIHRVRPRDTIEAALSEEYKFTARATEHGDFLEGIRAAIIEKGHQPVWKRASLGDVTGLDQSRMLMPLGDAALKL